MLGMESARRAGTEQPIAFSGELKKPSMTRVRPAILMVACIDDYCAHYRAVFHSVWDLDQFTQLILGMLAESKRKSLPRLAQTA